MGKEVMGMPFIIRESGRFHYFCNTVRAAGKTSRYGAMHGIGKRKDVVHDRYHLGCNLGVGTHTSALWQLYSMGNWGYTHDIR